MSPLSLTQIKNPDPVSNRGTKDLEREVMFRRTSVDSTHKVIWILCITSTDGQGHSPGPFTFNPIFKEEKESEDEF